jgi:Spy/CpxP family protein refolding chaperone
MKSSFFILFLLAILSFSTSIAQRGMRNDACRIPDLTEDQKNKTEVLRNQQMTASTHYRARMDELQARKRTLRVAETTDLNAINNIIDQMEKMRAEHLKRREAHHQQIRNLLTSEQKALFDSRLITRRQERGNGFCGTRDGRRGNSGLKQGRR